MSLLSPSLSLSLFPHFVLCLLSFLSLLSPLLSLKGGRQWAVGQQGQQTESSACFGSPHADTSMEMSSVDS